jgi:phage baseplate assembly protein W
MASTVVSRQPDYSDLDLDFIAHPTTGDVVRKKGVDAIKRSLRNLILTNHYERPFRSDIGSNIRRILFEPVTPLMANELNKFIKEVIDKYEPRVELVNVAVTIDPTDKSPIRANYGLFTQTRETFSNDLDSNAYRVDIIFKIVNRPEPLTATFFLERIR